MAELPTAADKARMVLNIFKHFGTRPGEVLRTNNFVAYAAKNGLRANDIADGLEYAYDQGLVEEGPNESHRLTDAGFAAI